MLMVIIKIEKNINFLEFSWRLDFVDIYFILVFLVFLFCIKIERIILKEFCTNVFKDFQTFFKVLRNVEILTKLLTMDLKYN